MGVLLQIYCIFSEHLFPGTPSNGCFWNEKLLKSILQCVASNSSCAFVFGWYYYKHLLTFNNSCNLQVAKYFDFGKFNKANVRKRKENFTCDFLYYSANISNSTMQILGAGIKYVNRINNKDIKTTLFAWLWYL